MRKKNDTVRYSAEELEAMRRRGEDRTDVERVRRMPDAEIEAQAREEAESFDWAKAEIGLPPSKKQLTVRFDRDIVDWFRAQGPGYQTRMNAVLRQYMEARKRESNQNQ